MIPSLPAVVLLGDINMDMFLDVPEYPAPGGDTHVYDLTMRGGGSVSNTAVGLARLGAAARLVACAGDDAWGDAALDGLRRAGVELKHVQRRAGVSTGLIFVAVTPDGERTMFSYRGANARLGPEQITPDIFEGAGVLHLSGYAFLKAPQSEAAWRAVRLAAGAGLRRTLDLGVDPARAPGIDMPRLLDGLDTLVVSAGEACRLTGESELPAAVQGLLRRGVKTVAVKLGKDGCLVAEPGNTARIPAFSVTAVDATGAGDAFSAGMIYGLLAGLSLGARGLLGNANGALTTTHRGGGESLPDRQTLADFLRVQPPAGDVPSAWREAALACLER